MKENPILLFDGECNFCNQAVQFILKRDKREFFRFGSLQGETGKKMARDYKLDKIDSIIFIDEPKIYIKSDAVIMVCRQLGWRWKSVVVFKIVPKRMRDYAYDMIAKNRYKWFGKRESCMIPTPELKKRFID